VRRHARDDHEGPEADARDRGGARRGRAGGRGRRSLSGIDVAALFDRAALTYDRAAFSFFGPFGEALAEYAQLRPDERVLDVGCGAGAALAPAARIARDVVGIDISPGMLERARAVVPEAELIVGDVRRLPFGDDSFDVVLSALVVFFLEDPVAGLREWARVLKPGGRLVMSTWAPGDERWSWERQLRSEFTSRVEPERLEQVTESVKRLARFDDVDKVAAELRAAGLEPVSVEPHQIEFHFDDEPAWWDWNMSHAGRAMVDLIGEEAGERLRERAFEAMQPLRDETGGFPRRYTAIFANAS
jgi:ubiquinone/menaquinone biosynthesis C-methylase UbiE